ncbi:MAG TPA: hypothetical protein VF188_05895 [Longimicrobiales bacterium]
MFRKQISRRSAAIRAAVLGLVATALITACHDDESPLFPGLSEALNAQLTDARSATEPFQQIQNANDAGYDVLVAHPTNGNTCLRHPELGAMGVHYLNAGLVDGTVAVATPEVVIYEPQADGSLELVGVEYIIPFAIRGDDQTPPVLFGREFRRNYTFNLWALHAWVWRDNPSGVFSDWNPDVSCEHEDAVGS